MKEKSVILLSGGLDSAYNLAAGAEETDLVLAITMDYGQKAALREIEFSGKLTKYFGVKHKIIKLPWLGEISKSALTVRDKEIPSPDIKSPEEIRKSAEKVWVANRNGLFVNIAACFAESIGAGQILVGFNIEEAETFSDNSEDFIAALNESLKYSTGKKIFVKSYTGSLTKKEIVKKGREKKFPFHLIWPCYEGGEVICRKCESCIRYLDAIGDEGSI